MAFQAVSTKSKSFARGIGIACALTAFSSAALAQAPAAAPVTFDNWTLSCSTVPGKDGKPVKTCEVRSDVAVIDEKTNQQVVAMTILFVRPMNEKIPQAVVRLPLAALLSVNPRLMGSDGKPIAEYGWVGCQPQLCGAMVSLTDSQVGMLRRIGDKFSVQYRNQLGQDIRIDGPTKGLGPALDALAKEK